MPRTPVLDRKRAPSTGEFVTGAAEVEPDIIKPGQDQGLKDAVSEVERSHDLASKDPKLWGDRKPLTREQIEARRKGDYVEPDLIPRDQVEAIDDSGTEKTAYVKRAVGRESDKLLVDLIPKEQMKAIAALRKREEQLDRLRRKEAGDALKAQQVTEKAAEQGRQKDGKRLEALMGGMIPPDQERLIAESRDKAHTNFLEKKKAGERQEKAAQAAVESVTTPSPVKHEEELVFSPDLEAGQRRIN